MKKIISICLVILLGASYNSNAQMAANAVEADPSASEIYLDPIASTITNSATMTFKLFNASLSDNGYIPAGSVYVTLSFPAQYGLAAVPTVPNFTVVYTELGPSGTMHLINSVAIAPYESAFGSFPIKAFAIGAGTTTYNVDRVSDPFVMVANTQTANDNSWVRPTVVAVLPVTLTDFSGIANNDCSVKLNWKTASEANTKLYELEYSNNGNSFETIAALPVQIGGVEHNYSYTTTKTSETGYYRLKIIDNDQTYTYSKVINIRSLCNGKEMMSLYPNIVNNETVIQLKIGTQYNGKAKLVYTNNLGQQIGQANIVLQQGVQQIPVQVGKLAQGIYYITVYTNDNKMIGSTQKFVK